MLYILHEIIIEVASYEKTPRLITRDKAFYQTLIRLAIPVALQNLITFSVTFADNLMVGQLGDAAVSGVYLGGQIQTFLQIFSGGVSGAILILSAQYWGKKDTASIKQLIAIGMRFCLCIGLALTLICLFFPAQILSIFTTDRSVIQQGSVYLQIISISFTFFCITQTLVAAMRSVEVVQISTFVSVISLITNVVLNYVLIFGKLGFQPMGIAGTAYQAAGLFGLVKSGGDVNFVLKNDTIFVFCIVLPSAILAAYLNAPAWLVFICLKSDQILKCIVAFFKINSFNWMQNLTETSSITIASSRKRF